MSARGLSLAAHGLVRRLPSSGFTLEIDRMEAGAGGVLAVLGPSGSGKSTLLALLGLLERPDVGTVLLDGAQVTTRDRAARLKMAAVFQRPYLIKGSVGANVAYGLAAHGIPRRERAARVAAALGRVGLEGWEKRSALSLSGGEAQRVSLARALVLEPRVLLLDEPLASLDPLLKSRLTRDFASILRESGVTVVYVTHDRDEALVVSDTVAVMREGRIVAQGPTDGVMGLPADDWVASFLGVEAPLSGRVARASDGLVWIECCGIEVAAVGDFGVGEPVVFGVQPEDVLLFEEDQEFQASSARNRLHARVVELAPRGATYRAVLESGGARFASTVSRAAVAELRLAVGVGVLAVFKATAVRVRGIDAGRVPQRVS